MKSKQKILFISHSGAWGGAEAMLFFLLEEFMRSQNYDPYLVVPAEGILMQKAIALGVETHIIPLDFWFKGKRARTRYKALRFIYHLRQPVMQLKEIIKERDIELVITNTCSPPQGAVAAAICGIPHLWYIHELVSQFPNSKSLYGLGAYFFMVDLLSKKIIVPSKAVQNEMLHYRSMKGKITVVKNAIEDVPSFTEKKSIIFPNKKELTVCFVGWLDERKRASDLIDVASIVLKQNPKVKFVLKALRDGAKEELQKKISDLNLTEAFQFIINKESAYEVIASSDVLILPSSSEPFGLVLLEAMAYGKPVVATRSGGPEEIVRDGETGFLCEVGDVEAMAKALTQLINNREKAQAMGIEARKSFETNFSLEEYLQHFKMLVNEMMACPKRQNVATIWLLRCLFFIFDIAYLFKRNLTFQNHQSKSIRT